MASTVFSLPLLAPIEADVVLLLVQVQQVQQVGLEDVSLVGEVLEGAQLARARDRAPDGHWALLRSEAAREEGLLDEGVNACEKDGAFFEYAFVFRKVLRMHLESL